MTAEGRVPKLPKSIRETEVRRVPNVTMKIDFDPAARVKALRDRWRNGLPELSARVLADCNTYARDDTGRLIASAKTASDLKTGRLIWSTGYARRVYYTGAPSRARNPNASLRWCEKAKAACLPEWQRLAAKKLGGGKT